MLVAHSAHAERGLHGGVGAGSTFVLSGSEGDRFRYDVIVDLKPRSRYGVVLAWRAFDQDRRGLVTAGLVYEGAAARPRLVLDLHVDVGADLDRPAPLAGGGVRATLTVIGPLGVAFDLASYLVLDGIDDSRLQLQSNAVLVARW
ncbi:MAG: hypothetical protein JWP01_1419 [Myxococcales bacterium]|nr:hypothetical protein [Myxococcales bacterium]